MLKSTKKLPKDKSENPRLQLLLDNLELPGEGEALYESNRVQPSLFGKAAEYRIDRMRIRQQADMDYDLLKAEVADEVRKEATQRGEKVTELMMKESLALDPKLRTMQEKVNKAEREEEHAKLLVEAYKHRRDSIRVAADMVRREEISFNDSRRIGKDLETAARKRFPKGDA